MFMSRFPIQAVISDEVLPRHLLDRRNPFMDLALRTWKLIQEISGLQNGVPVYWGSFSSKRVTEELPEYEGRTWFYRWFYR